MSQFHLAQLNIATALAEMDSPVMKDFVDNLERINLLGEQSPGFVWRMKDDSGNATAIPVYDDPSIIANLTVWQDPESLKNFLFKTEHAQFLKRKKEWFMPVKQATYVLWWIPAGHLPTLPEAKAKLATLREHGETAQAFSFKKLFPAETEKQD
ncbi:DUF3291 domain-containing protein [Planctobacterium marinum]|uniref:DUF3291 domain-containing protein n=1 Tax=Planctobacterium marinum TaxID=1631968 RepID=UPI001E4F57C5|nr:DUF3291 domain-containing protein [Planctobacterium marinum]MCC2605263.1 DUF3291 domain-containing protein [Planctobacterium marinum]